MYDADREKWWFVVSYRRHITIFWGINAARPKQKVPFRCKRTSILRNTIKSLWHASWGMAQSTWTDKYCANIQHIEKCYICHCLSCKVSTRQNDWRVSPFWSIDSRGGITLHYIHNLIWLWFVRCSVRFDGNNCL